MEVPSILPGVGTGNDAELQTTNLGVRISNLFGRANEINTFGFLRVPKNMCKVHIRVHARRRENQMIFQTERERFARWRL